ncbi:hypothetical protein Y032_0059g3058 [Ancylostoma ceylanicum]|uniref:Uncharacterized protein n=1 Tax=Ancylostoma ceylanicum TaxID=53326 RepID=A0A016U498_9BILA|nr:hypothetical protein Y032_0059g3058 [Ancylostoma ceylanicum]
MGNAQTRTEASRRKKRLGRQRRLSEPENDYNENKLRPRGMKCSMSGATTPISATPPRIQINGMESTEEVEDWQKGKSSSMVCSRCFP